MGYQALEAIGLINQYQDRLFGGSLLNFKYAVHRLRIKGIGAKSIQATGWKGDNAALSDNSRGVLNYIQVRIFRTYFI